MPALGAEVCDLPGGGRGLSLLGADLRDGQWSCMVMKAPALGHRVLFENAMNMTHS
jgi:hypothetical protein